MSQNQKCCQCFEPFSESNCPRELPACSHNICTKCLREIIENKQDVISCYFCSNVISKANIRLFPKNTRLLALLKENHELSLSKSFEGDSGEKNEKKPDDGGQLLLGETPAQSLDDRAICKLHDKPFDIVCISDKLPICPHCAIFGNHKDHRFKTIRQFDQQIDEKVQMFLQIIAKNKSNAEKIKKAYEDLKPPLENKEAALEKFINIKFTQLENELKNAKATALKEVKSTFQGITKRMTDASNRQICRLLEKMNRWEKDCSMVIDKLNNTKVNADKIVVFYESPLEIVSQGLIFLQEIEQERGNYVHNLRDLVESVQVVVNSHEVEGLHKYARVKVQDKANVLPHNSDLDGENEANPFIWGSQLDISRHADDSIHLRMNMSNCEVNETRATGLYEEPKMENSSKRVIKKIEPTLKHAKSLTNLGKEVNTFKPDIRTSKRQTDKKFVFDAKRMISSEKSLTAKFQNPIVSKFNADKFKKQVNIANKFERPIRDAEKIITQFSKNHLSDVFDLSDCQLEDQAVRNYVQQARKIHRTKGLKLSGNLLTSEGFEAMIDCLQGVSNINLSNNLLDNSIFDIIVRNRKLLESLRIIHLSRNEISVNRSVLGPRYDEVKKMGITLVL